MALRRRRLLEHPCHFFHAEEKAMIKISARKSTRNAWPCAGGGF